MRTVTVRRSKPRMAGRYGHQPRPLPVLLVLLGCCAQAFLSDCPRLCECKWKSGKEAVSCVSANYSSIPPDIDPGTQLLDLSANNLMRLQQDEFKKVGLINLQKIYLAKCRLKLVDKNAFRDLINLVELDLSQNYLYSVPSYILHTMPELRELKINSNPIQRIQNKAFVFVPKLVRLEFSDCKIGTIEEKAFEGIEDSLQWLKLDGNQLTEVKASTFTSIGKMHGLELAGNPWNCTCSLRPLREWMIHQNVPFEVPPTCKAPKRLSSKSWKGLELDEFACVPRIQAPDPKAHGIEGSDVTITCTINGVPEPNIRWLLKNRVIANRTSVSVSSGKKQYVVHIQDNSSNLTIQTADIQDAGVYVCSAENKAGKVEASVTLAVSRKPPESESDSKVVIVGAVIAIVFVSVTTFLAVCICSVRRRRQGVRWQGRRTASGRRHDDNYEKIEMRKLTDNTAANTAPVASVASEVPLLGPTKRNGEYCVVPSMDTDQELDEEDAQYDDNIETPTPTNVNRSRESKLWTAAATGRSISSPNSGHWNSNVCDSNLDPEDLHIPRRTKEETRDAYSKTPSLISGIYNQRESSVSDINTQTPDKPHRVLPSIPQSIQPHIMKKQLLPNNGSLYSSVPVSSEVNMERLLNPDLEERPNGFDIVNGYDEISEINSRTSNRLMSDVMESDNLYCTLPRNKLAYGKSRTRYRSCDSESPLLPRSRYGSSGGDSSSGSRSSSRRYSEDSMKFSLLNQPSNLNQRSSSYLNLAPARQQQLFLSNKSSPPDSTPLLNVGALESRLEECKDSLLSPSSNISMPTRRSPFNDRAAQLEMFLEGYINVHNQLSSMKEICDKLKQQQDDEKQIRAGLFADPLLLTECQESNPKSILKKSVSTLSSVSPMYAANSRRESPSTSADWSTYRTNQYDTNKRFY